MAKSKFYAVKVGKQPGVYQTWNQCKEQTDGFSGAVYKSFSTLAEAESFLSSVTVNMTIDNSDNEQDLNQEIEYKIQGLAEDEVIAFVDGSFDATEEKSAFGALIFCNGNKERLYKAYTKKNWS